jgi:tRNA pseudouridine55 synthase
MIGFLNVFKPAGPTSHDVVAAARRRLPRKVKVGHCGTLDPFAEGVLVLCVGAATRLAQYVHRLPKRYIASVTLGASSATDDPTGEITPAPPAGGPPSAAQVRACAAAFVGEINQAPPAHSAIHVAGQRAYELARRGEAPAISPRPVVIHGIDVLRYEYPLLELDVRCGGGTYIRALARDIGAALGTAAYCSRLARTEIGAFHSSQAVRVEELDAARHLLSPLCALEGIGRRVISEADRARVKMGQDIALSESAGASRGPKESVTGREWALVSEAGELLAIAEEDAARGALHPKIVLCA